MRNQSGQNGESLARRDFLTLGLTVAAATALPSGLLRAQAPTSVAGALGRRKLGALEVSSLGLGCMSMAGVYNAQPDRQEMVALIRAAYDRGVTFFDTAEVYGPFISEEVVGEALAPLKGKVQIASTFGFDVQAPSAPGQSIAAGRRRDSRPEHIRRAVKGSLNWRWCGRSVWVIAARRLGAEQINMLGRHADRVALARAFGATDVVSERGEAAIARVRELTGGLGAHSVLECVGHGESMLTAVSIARAGGAVGRVGLPQEQAMPGALPSFLATSRSQAVRRRCVPTWSNYCLT